MKIFGNKVGMIPFSIVVVGLFFAAIAYGVMLQGDAFAVKDLKGESQFSYLTLQSEVQGFELLNDIIVQDKAIEGLYFALNVDGFNSAEDCSSSFEGYSLLNFEDCRFSVDSYSSVLASNVSSEANDSFVLNGSEVEYKYESGLGVVEKRAYSFLFEPDYVVSYSGNSVVVSSKSAYKVVDVEYGMWYSDKFSSHVDLGVSLEEELGLLQSQAAGLYAACASAERLEDCIETNKQSNWFYSLCGGDEEFESIGSQVAFCVSSLSDVSYIRSDGSKFDLDFKFAMDFSGKSTSAVKGLDVIVNKSLVYEEGAFFGSFDYSEGLGESYVLYVTDKKDLDYTGTASQFSDLMFGQGVFEAVELEVVGSCPTDLSSYENGKVYICDDKLQFVYYDWVNIGFTYVPDGEGNYILDEEYYAAVVPVVLGAALGLEGFVEAEYVDEGDNTEVTVLDVVFEGEDNIDESTIVIE